MPNNAEPFCTVPQISESFGTVPHAAETFRSLPNTSERTDNHTLTVREVARMFEAAGVARTERSIVNWCQPNRQGIARLNAYFDMNDRRWFITRQSVESAIAEEKAKAVKVGPDPSERGETTPQASEVGHDTARSHPDEEADHNNSAGLDKELMDLRILNRGKDYFIEQLQKEREGFALERREYIEKLMTFNRKVGELETTLNGLKAPDESTSDSQGRVAR